MTYLIKDNDTIRFQLFGDKAGYLTTTFLILFYALTYLWIEDILIVVDEDVGMGDDMTSKKVRTPSFLFAKLCIIYTSPE